MIKLLTIVNEVLHEEERATRERVVLTLSRELIKAFNSGTNRYTDFIELVRGEESADTHLDVRFYKRPKQEHAFSIAASAGPKSSKESDQNLLEIKVEYNPSKFPQAMNAFVAEVKETLEHELEHIAQQNYEDLFVMSNKYDEPLAYPEEAPTAPTHYLYLVSNVEVPAYVKGLIKRARVKKISFEDALEDYYNDYRETFALYNTDWNAVKSVWMDWYNKNKQKLKSTR